MKTFKSKCGKHNIKVSKEDYKRVLAFAPNGWEAKYTTGSNNPYAVTRKTVDVDGGRKRKKYYLHRLVMDVLNNPDVIVDHKSRNPLDNTRKNLRLTTHALNMKNRTSKKNGTCKHLGVFATVSKKGIKKFRVSIQEPKIKKGNMHLGYYYDEESAGYAYNCAAEILHGDFANLNLIKNLNDADLIKEDVLNRLKNYGME